MGNKIEEFGVTLDDVEAWTALRGDPAPLLGAAARAWAGASSSVGRTATYALPSLPRCGEHAGPDILSPAYEAKAEAAAEVQLEKAGVRLAWAINAVLW